MGIPTAHICSITPVALMVGSNRIIPGNKIVNPVGNAELTPQEEKSFRREILEKALKSLETEIEAQRIFT